MIQEGTYVREPDGALLLFHSPTTWDSPVDGLRASKDAEASPLWYWRLVYGEEAEEVHRRYGLMPGEYIEVIYGRKGGL